MTTNTQNERPTPNLDSSNAPVTVLGLGLMGRALAAAFLDDGHPTTVWNRTPHKADQLVESGAALAATVGDAVAASPLVIICVSDYDAMHELLDPLDDNLGGRVIVNLTSGTSADARETAEWAAQRDITYIDGAIMAIPPAIGTSDAVILYSGPREAYDDHESALAHLATALYLADDHGLSALYDATGLAMMWSVLNAFLQGTALLGASGVPATAFAPFAAQMTRTLAGWLADVGQQIDDGAYPAHDSTLDTHLAAMQHLIDESEAARVNAELPRLIKSLADRAVADGRGADSYAALIEQFRRPATP